MMKPTRALMLAGIGAALSLAVAAIVRPGLLGRQQAWSRASKAHRRTAAVLRASVGLEPATDTTVTAMVRVFGYPCLAKCSHFDDSALTALRSATTTLDYTSIVAPNRTTDDSDTIRVRRCRRSPRDPFHCDSWALSSAARSRLAFVIDSAMLRLPVVLLDGHLLNVVPSVRQIGADIRNVSNRLGREGR
jgi:hypothetical protein